MDLYVILRRNGWRTAGDLQEAVVYVCGDPEPVRAEVLPAP